MIINSLIFQLNWLTPDSFIQQSGAPVGLVSSGLWGITPRKLGPELQLEIESRTPPA